MTDKNQAALSVFDNGCQGEHINEHCAGPETVHTQSGVYGFNFTVDEIEIIRAALTSPSAGVDVSLVREHLERGLRAVSHASCLGYIHEALTSIPDMREAWQGIESAPREGTHILIARKKNKRQHNIKRFVIQAFWVSRFKYWQLLNGGGAFDEDIDGWQPLPAAPKGGKL